MSLEGGKRDSVNVAAFKKPYLESIAVKSFYKTDETNAALFLTLYHGVPNRDASSVEKMVAKYSGLSHVTPH